MPGPTFAFMKMRKFPVGNTSALLTLFLTPVLVTSCDKPASNAKAGPPPVNVTVAQPVAQKITEWDEFSGRLAAPETVEIRARVSGYLDKIHFKEGALVKQGDVLFTIDPRPYEAEVARLEAEVARLMSRTELARIEATNAERLQRTQAISTEEVQRRFKSLVEAEAAVKGAESALTAAKLDLSFTEVRSPIEGRISNARVTIGNLVRGGTQETTLLTTVVSVDPIYVYFEVDERSALKYRDLIREGKRASALDGSIPAEMGLANQADFPHRGAVDFVDNVLDPTTGTIRARAVFRNEDRLMAPGFFARVRIPGSGEYDGLLVRDNAINDDQGTSFVWIVGEDGKATYTKIELGPLVDGLRVVRSGLQGNEQIIINGQINVRPGGVVAAQPGQMIETAPATAAAPAK